MEIPITVITTGILGLLFLIHTIRVIGDRNTYNLSLGDGGHESMQRKIRTHANFAEYIPLLLLILLLLELSAVPTILLVVYSCVLVVCRGIHAYGMLPVGGVLWARVVGMIGTMALLGVGSIYLVLHGLGLL